MGAFTGAFVLLFRMDAASPAYYPLLILLGSLLSAVTALQIIFLYKQPCEVMDLRHYSLYVSVDGILSGLTGIASGVLLSVCFAKFPFVRVSSGAYLTAALCLCLGALANGFMRTLPDREIPTEKENNPISCLKELLADRSFRFLAIPNVLRGFSMGLISMVMVLAVRAVGIPESDSAIVATCANLAVFVGCALYGLLTPRLGAHRVCLLGGFCFCFIIPAFLGGRILFFVLYSVAHLGYNIVGNAVPDLIYQNVSPTIMGPYHTWRLAFSTVGATLATAFLSALIDVLSPVVLVIICVLCFLGCPLAYTKFFTKPNR